MLATDELEISEDSLLVPVLLLEVAGAEPLEPVALPGSAELVGSWTSDDGVSFSGSVGLLESSEQAAIIIMAETAVPTNNLLLNFIGVTSQNTFSIYNFLLKIASQFRPIRTFKTARVLVNALPFGGSIAKFRKSAMFQVEFLDQIEHPVRNL